MSLKTETVIFSIIILISLYEYCKIDEPQYLKLLLINVLISLGIIPVIHCVFLLEFHPSTFLTGKRATIFHLPIHHVQVVFQSHFFHCLWEPDIIKLNPYITLCKFIYRLTKVEMIWQKTSSSVTNWFFSIFPWYKCLDHLWDSGIKSWNIQHVFILKICKFHVGIC